MGWFWADKVPDQAKSALKVDDAPAKCPVDHSKMNISACPVVKKGGDASDDLNPLNNMPYTLSTQKAPGQKIDLPTTRTLSSIPRGEKKDEGVWEYPSPQQMFNAMLRKGKGEVPEDAVESMVSIHNFLNEGAWAEILQWEKPYTEQSNEEPRLLKFTGRPHDMTPKARLYQALGAIFPDKYGTEPPFDRHDWTVLRGDGQKVRYVIDYYGGPEDEEGLPTFYLDVRPALDNLSNAKDLVNHWVLETKPTWDKALGRTQ